MNKVWLLIFIAIGGGSSTPPAIHTERLATKADCEAVGKAMIDAGKRANSWVSSAFSCTEIGK